VALGFDRGGIQRRVAAGRLHRLHRGVYAVGHTILSRNGAYLAAVLACGPDAVLSHRSAAALWDLRPSDAPRIDVTVPHTSGFRTTKTIVVHRPLRTPDPMTHAGVPVTTPGRTLADLALGLPRRQLENAVEAAERLRLHIDIDDDHPGAKRLREAATDDLPFTRSELEDAFLDLCDRYDIPRPLVNSIQEGCEVDFCWPEHRLIVEADGDHHQTRAAFERDRARDARLTALSWRVMRFTARQVRRGPARVAALVLSARSPSLVTPG
jgi:very-short-patch-repair endonuclease